MDESWRMRTGIPNGGPIRRRRSMTERRVPPADPEGTAELEPQDFDDVFGGPPRTLLARKHSADFTGCEWFYREIFRGPADEIPLSVPGRRLPEIAIPEHNREFEGRRFKGKGKGKKWMSKSKSTSSSVLSFEEVSQMSAYRWAVEGDEHEVHEDVALSSYTSRLRPINVPSRWSSSSTSRIPKTKNKNNNQDLPAFGCTTIENNVQCNNFITRSFNYNNGFPRRVTSPETINLMEEATSLRIPIMDGYDMQQFNSPSSDVSSHYHFNLNENMTYQQKENNKEEESEDVASSYVIEMNSRTTEANNNLEAIDIDEAIAWAKEKFRGWSLDDGNASHTAQENNLFGDIQVDY